VSPANGNEREALWEIVGHTSGLYLADKGYLGEALKNALMKEQGIDLQTPLRGNMKDPRPVQAVKLMTRIRRRIETVIGQLTERFHIEKVRARDRWHLTSRKARKILAHTMGIFINRQLGREPLHFDGLIGA